MAVPVEVPEAEAAMKERVAAAKAAALEVVRAVAEEVAKGPTPQGAYQEVVASQGAVETLRTTCP